MINKISNITPKKMFPLVAAGLMTLTSCATLEQAKVKEYCLCTNRTETEYWDIMNKMGDTKSDQQARLDSLVYRDIFNGTKLAFDSAAVADFNKIYSNRLYTENHNNFLKENGCTDEDIEGIERLNDKKKQFETDYYLFNRLLDKYNANTPEIEKKIDKAGYYLYPSNQYYFNEIFGPCWNGSCPTKK